MSEKIKPYVIIGGIGDFLQYLDSVISLQSQPEAKFIVYSHFKGAAAFFAPFADLTKFQFHYFEGSNPYDHLSDEAKDQMVHCPRTSKIMHPPERAAVPGSNHNFVGRLRRSRPEDDDFFIPELQMQPFGKRKSRVGGSKTICAWA